MKTCVILFTNLILATALIKITNKNYIRNLLVGSNVYIFCNSSGNSNGRWMLNNVQRDDPRFYINNSSHNQEILSIKNLEKNDSGVYKCHSPSSSDEESIYIGVYEQHDLLDVSLTSEESHLDKQFVIYTFHNISSIIYTPSYGGPLEYNLKDVSFNITNKTKYINIEITNSAEFLYNGRQSITLKSLPGIEYTWKFNLPIPYKPIVRSFHQNFPITEAEKQITLKNICAVWANPVSRITMIVTWDCPYSNLPCLHNFSISSSDDHYFYNLPSLFVEEVSTWKLNIECQLSNFLGKAIARNDVCIFFNNFKHFDITGPQPYVFAGSNVTLMCRVPNYCFYKENVILLRDFGGIEQEVTKNLYAIHKDRFSYYLQYNVEEMSAEYDGIYTCVVQEKHTNLTKRSNSLQISTTPKNNLIIEIDLSDNWLLSCNFTAYPPFHFNVLFTEMDNPEVEIVLDNGTVYNNFYAFKKIVRKSGRCRCTASNSFGNKEALVKVCNTEDSLRPIEGGSVEANKKYDIRMYHTVEGDINQVVCIIPNCYYHRNFELHYKPFNGQPQILNNTLITSTDFNRKITVTLLPTPVRGEGVYRCIAFRVVDNTSSDAITSFPIEENTTLNVVIIIILAVILFIFGYCWYQKNAQVRNSKMLITELKKGNIGRRNPNLPLQNQADILPLDSKWEFPRNRLKLGQELGSGCYGVVLQAEAQGILKKGVTTTVAVKMAKKHSDGDVLRGLVGELKIMAAMGSHPHIVRLLGAILDGLGDNEIMIVLEFCRFGSILDYLMRHRQRFITNWIARREVSSVKASSKTNENTPRYLPMGSCLKNPEVPGPSNIYQNDESMELNTDVLISWSFQISRGMEWLASRKLFHGDLAARNVLLTSGNIVKISDFGLAKNMYSQSYFKRQELTKIPIKWMALECIKDNVFTIQSDVWSYGVLLWEIFSMGCTPYHEIEDLLGSLQAGYRLKKPEYAPVYMHQIMRRCWMVDPADRPNFSQLSLDLYEFLSDEKKSALSAFEAEFSLDSSGADYLQFLGDSPSSETAGYLELSAFGTITVDNSVEESEAKNLNCSDDQEINFSSDYMIPLIQI